MSTGSPCLGSKFLSIYVYIYISLCMYTYTHKNAHMLKCFKVLLEFHRVFFHSVGYSLGLQHHLRRPRQDIDSAGMRQCFGCGLVSGIMSSWGSDTSVCIVVARNRSHGSYLQDSKYVINICLTGSAIFAVSRGFKVRSGNIWNGIEAVMVLTLIIHDNSTYNLI